MTAILVLIGSVTLASAQHGSDEPVMLVTGDDFKPYTDSSLPGGGLVTDIVRAVYGGLGDDIRIRVLPWKRGYQDALRGRYDATFPYIPTSRREQDFIYSDPVFTLTLRPVVLDDDELSASKPADLKGLVYCFPLGYATTGWFDEMTRNGEVTRETPSSMTQCLQMLARDRVDFVVVSTEQARDTARNVLGAPDRIKPLEIVIEDKTLHTIFPRTSEESPAAVTRFNAGLRALKASGRYQEIVERHLQSDM